MAVCKASCAFSNTGPKTSAGLSTAASSTARVYMSGGAVVTGVTAMTLAPTSATPVVT